MYISDLYIYIPGLLDFTLRFSHWVGLGRVSWSPIRPNCCGSVCDNCSCDVLK